MKANEAPEKIYLKPLLMEDGESIVRQCTFERNSDCEFEYTNTDAFMKKAENFLEMLGYGFTITDNITHKNYDEEQLIADFRNYMEE